MADKKKEKKYEPKIATNVSEKGAAAIANSFAGNTGLKMFKKEKKKPAPKKMTIRKRY